jgi:hypothetical protein
MRAIFNRIPECHSFPIHDRYMVQTNKLSQPIPNQLDLRLVSNDSAIASGSASDR